MNKQLVSHDYDNKLWNTLKTTFGLTEQQLFQLERYAVLLIEWNKKFNLTAIVDIPKIITYHFYDSMKIADYIDFTQISSIVDVGTGAGFPALPLKILFPHLKVTLIEVNHKKCAFLEYIIKEFGLENVTLFSEDWRTFLRKTEDSVDYFFSRASLQPEELIRIFKPSSFYKNATLVYWASAQWIPQKSEAPFIKKEVDYTIDGVHRKYVFFQQNNI